MSQCPRCGADVSADMNFCGVCGKRVAGSHSTISFAPGFLDEEESRTASGDAGAALVELDQVEGTAGRRMHDIENESLTVGRSQKSGIVLDDVTVSRDHAEIKGRNGEYRVRDTGSLNGTYVNRVRVDSVDLRNGDEIQIGKYRFKFIIT